MDRSGLAPPPKAGRLLAIPEVTLRVPEKAFLLRGCQPVDERTLRQSRLDRETTATEEYLAQLEAGSVTPLDPELDYRSRVRALVEKAPAMDKACRLAVNVPAFCEQATITRFLNSYLRQQGTGDWTWELNVLVNAPAGCIRDETEARAREFLEPFRRQGARLNVLSVEFPPPVASVGLARRMLVDFVLMRSSQRGARRGPLVIKHEDADTFGHSRHLLTAGVRCLDDRPALDAVVHRISYDPDILRRHDGLRLERLIYLATERGFFRAMADLRSSSLRLGDPMPMSARKFRVLTSGFSTFCTVECLALLCGGFSAITRSEDLQFGDKLSILRGTRDGERVLLEADTVGTVAERSASDLRRAARNLEEALRCGLLPDDPYADFNDLDRAASLRALDVRTRLASAPLSRYADLRSDDAVAGELTNIVLDYYSRLVEKIIPPRRSEVLARYADFLAALFPSRPTAILVREGRIVVGNPEGIRAAPLLSRLPAY